MTLYNKSGQKIEGMTVADYDASFGAGKAAAAGFTETQGTTPPAPPAPPTLNPQGVAYANTNRNKISDTPQAGYIKGYDTDQAYKEVYVPKGLYIPGISPTPNQITVKNLQEKESPINLNVGNVEDNNADATMAGLSAEQKAYQTKINELTLPDTEIEKKEQGILDLMTGLTEEGTKKGEEQLKLEQEAGLPDLKSQLSDISGQMTSLEAEYNAYKQEELGRPQTMERYTGSIAAKKNKVASDMLLLSAKGNMLQGRLDTAQANVNRAIDLKYSTIDNQYKIYQAQLDALKPTLNREEKIRSEAMSQMNADRQRVLDEAKQAEKDEKNYLLDLMNKYPDAEINFNDSFAIAQDKIKNSKIYQDQVRMVKQQAPVQSPNNKNKTSGFNEKIALPKVQQYFSTVVGGDGFVSPESYLTARNAWIEDGGNPTTFDTKMKGFRNPNNQNYSIIKTPTSKTTEKVPEEVETKSWWEKLLGI